MSVLLQIKVSKVPQIFLHTPEVRHLVSIILSSSDKIGLPLIRRVSYHTSSAWAYNLITSSVTITVFSGTLATANLL